MWRLPLSSQCLHGALDGHNIRAPLAVFKLRGGGRPTGFQLSSFPRPRAAPDRVWSNVATTLTSGRPVMRRGILK